MPNNPAVRSSQHINSNDQTSAYFNADSDRAVAEDLELGLALQDSMNFAHNEELEQENLAIILSQTQQEEESASLNEIETHLAIVGEIDKNIESENERMLLEAIRASIEHETQNRNNVASSASYENMRNRQAQRIQASSGFLRPNLPSREVVLQRERIPSKPNLHHESKKDSTLNTTIFHNKKI